MVRSDLTCVVPYSVLRSVTFGVTHVWGCGPVRVWPLPPHLEGVLDGRALASARVVWYAKSAPLHTVAHELAHIVTPDEPGHGERWMTCFCGLLDPVWSIYARAVTSCLHGSGGCPSGR